MSVIGLPRYDEPDAYYRQDNNAVEQILHKLEAKVRLATCGPTAAVTILDAMGVLKIPTTSGGWNPQPEDILSLWFNDPRNYPRLKSTREDVNPAEYMGNEVPQYYQAAIPAVFGVPCNFVWGCSPELIKQDLTRGKGVMICFKDPGHYVAVVGYDTEKNETIYHDAWGNNWYPQRLRNTSGFMRQLNQDEFINVHQYRVIIG